MMYSIGHRAAQSTIIGLTFCPLYLWSAGFDFVTLMLQLIGCMEHGEAKPA